MNAHQWIEQNYKEIIQWSKNISKNSEYKDLAHYVIEQFLLRPDKDEITQDGAARWFIVRTMLNSFRSSTSQYHTIYRQKGRVNTELPELQQAEPYNPEIDLLFQQAESILQEMLQSKDSKLWYIANLFQRWVEQPNYPKLSC